MDKELYVIKDIKSGLFTDPSCLVNRECAKRWFLDLCKHLQGGVAPSDLQLYYIGVFNDSLGDLSYDGIEYIMDGVDNG